MPLSGLFDTYPDTGSEEFASGPSVLSLQTLPFANSVPDATLDSTGSGEPVSVFTNAWSILTPGFIFWEPRHAQQNGGNFGNPLQRTDGYVFMYMMSAYPLADPTNYVVSENLPIDTPLKLFFSAPVDAARTTMSLVPAAYLANVPTIPARMAVNGAVVTVTPRRQLEHGLEYTLESDDGAVYSTLSDFGPAFNRLRMNTRNNLQADGAPSPAVATPGQTVSLQSTRSFSRNSSIEHYQWTQTSGTPVQLTDAETATATFVVPGSASDGEALGFRLTIEDANGETDSVRATAYAFSDLTRPFYYHRRAQGSGQGVTAEVPRLTSPLDGVITTEFASDNQFRFFLSPGGSVPHDSVDLTNFPRSAGGVYSFICGARVTSHISLSEYPGCNEPFGKFVVRDIVLLPYVRSGEVSPPTTNFTAQAEWRLLLDQCA